MERRRPVADTTPLQAHRHEDVTIALLGHRMKAVEAMCARSVEQGDALLTQLADIKTSLALGNQRMNEVDKHLEATDSRVTTIEGDKRGTAGMWTSIAAALAAIGSYFK